MSIISGGILQSGGLYRASYTQGGELELILVDILESEDSIYMFSSEDGANILSGEGESRRVMPLRNGYIDSGELREMLLSVLESEDSTYILASEDGVALVSESNDTNTSRLINSFRQKGTYGQ